MATEAAKRTIVVGIDGSPGADEALRWALSEARLRRSNLRIVHAYELPLTTMGEAGMAPGGIAPLPVFSEEEATRLRSGAEEQARRLIEDALGRADAEATVDLEIEQSLRAGGASEILIDAGRDAELLVLGSRGRGGFLGLLLGSVSQQIAQHPPCPVVILPPPEEADEAG